MRTSLFAGNWKMYKTTGEAVAVAQALRSSLEKEPSSHEVVVIPSFTALHAVAQALKGGPVALGAQNMHWEKEGAFTGEVSPVMLKDVGCAFVVLGHSERRQLFSETDDGVGKKARAALDQGLTPIVCVGETLAERESARTFEVVERQVERGLRDLQPGEIPRIVIAYEPVWAIGTGKVATPEQAQEVHAFVRKQVGRSHGEAPAAAVRILYGGSVKPDNAAGLMAQPDLDGALIGGASLSAESFLKIVRAG